MSETREKHHKKTSVASFITKHNIMLRTNNSLNNLSNLNVILLIFLLCEERFRHTCFRVRTIADFV